MKIKGTYKGQEASPGSKYKPRKIFIDDMGIAPFNFDWGKDSGSGGDVLAEVICTVDTTKQYMIIREIIEKLPKTDFEIEL